MGIDTALGPVMGVTSRPLQRAKAKVPSSISSPCHTQYTTHRNTETPPHPSRASMEPPVMRPSIGGAPRRRASMAPGASVSSSSRGGRMPIANTGTSTTATTSTAAAVADPGSPSYPTSAPDNPNIQIPVTMGCMEAKCETWMAAMGKNHGDPANLILLDCIQRTGMSADGTKTCFANSNVTASPVRMGLYQCAVCKSCMPPLSKDEEAALCQTSPISSSSTAAPASSTETASPRAPSASDWDRYLPKGYAP